MKRIRPLPERSTQNRQLFYAIKVKGLEHGVDLSQHMAERICMFRDGSAPVEFRFNKHLIVIICFYLRSDDFTGGFLLPLHGKLGDFVLRT